MKKRLVTVLLCAAMLAGMTSNVSASDNAEPVSRETQGVTANEDRHELAGEVADNTKQNGTSRQVILTAASDSNDKTPTDKLRLFAGTSDGEQSEETEADAEESKLQKLAADVKDAAENGSSSKLRACIDVMSAELGRTSDPMVRVTMESSLDEYRKTADLKEEEEIEAAKEKAESDTIDLVKTVWDFEQGEIIGDADAERIEEVRASVEELENEELKADLLDACDAASYCLEKHIRPKAEIEAAKKAAEEAAAAQAAARQAQAAAVGASGYYGNCRITFYCTGPCCNGGGSGTASGAPLTPYLTVANGDLPFGTQLLIDGQIYVVQDRGVGAQQIDICVASHEECEARGLYYTDVYIVG